MVSECGICARQYLMMETSALHSHKVSVTASVALLGERHVVTDRQ